MTDRARILVVDDERRNRALVVAYLSEAYEILEAENASRAIEIVSGQPVDLVLLDVVMPGASGFEACRELKARSRGAFLPVILLTSLSDQENRNQGLAAGADDYVTKPVDRVELSLRCRAFLEIRRKEQDLRQLQAVKEDLFSLIVHDLRNPLAGIDGYLQLLQAELAAREEPALKADVDRALQSSRKLREILDGVLDVRLLEEGELELRREPIAVQALVADAIATLEGAGEAQRVPIRASVAADAVVLADRKLVRRALENLIANAVKYSPQGQPVEVEGRAVDGQVEIDVSDRGHGIPDALKGSLFTKFGSIEARSGQARRGYGLGLHLVKLVAEAHGGKVSVRDREGGGSVFRLALPRAGRQ